MTLTTIIVFKKSIISSTCALALLATLSIKSPELKAKEALQGGTLKDASHAIDTEMLLNALENRSDELSRTVERVLFIRALHNLNRLESEAGTMTEALATAKLLIKGKRAVTASIFSPQICHPILFIHLKRIAVDETSQSKQATTHIYACA
jgi:hypothetical protein